MVVLLAGTAASAQEQEPCERDRRLDELFDVFGRTVRGWGGVSGLGDLSSAGAYLSPDDVEVRFWLGFGGDTPRGLVLQRRGGEWQTREVVVSRHRVADTDSLARADGLLPPSVLGMMGGWCEIETIRHMGSGAKAGAVTETRYHLECPRVHDRGGGPRLAVLWDDLVGAGLLSLENDGRVGLDGTSFLVEVWDDGDYRTAKFRHLAGNEDPARAPYRDLVRLLAPRLGRHDFVLDR